MENKNLIEVRSLSLLKAIYDAKSLSCLRRIEHETDEDGNIWPVFCFAETPEIIDVCNAYLDEHGADDRNADNPDLWRGYAMDKVNLADKPTINTRNYVVLKRIFVSGLMGNLISVRREGVKTVYRFIASDELREIKSEEDAKSQARWEKWQQQEGNNREAV